MTEALARPSYKEAVRYYLRDDVSAYFWQLCQSRPLKFFHHCDTDPRGPARARPRAIALHCVATVKELRNRVEAAASTRPEYPYDFFPFWGMQGNQVNAPGEPSRTLGWDMRFEFDYRLQDSFAVLLPMVAVLENFGVSSLAKYSGHRSLHLVIPAESFPLPLKQRAAHLEWMATIELLGDLLCRVAPYLIPTNVGLSKDLTLTAPYSLHRYHGLISLPLNLEQALAFDPEAARLAAVRTPAWPFPNPWCEGVGMQALLDYAKRVQDDPSLVLELAEQAFGDVRWAGFVEQNLPPGIPAGSPLAALMAGAPGVSPSDLLRDRSPQADRLRRALIAMDVPAHKEIRFSRLVGNMDHHHDFEPRVRLRRIRAEALNTWALEGLDAALERIVAIAADERYAAPVVLAARLVSFLPAAEDHLTGTLLQAWSAGGRYGEAARLFLAIALAERSGERDQVPEALCGQKDTPTLSRFKSTLREAGSWQAEARPDLALAALVLGFGEDRVRSWITDPSGETGRRVVKGIFGGKAGKFQHAARRVGLFSGS